MTGQQRNSFAPDYNDVPSRIAEFKAKHPDGALQPWDKAEPFKVITIGPDTFIVVVAAAYRSKDDTVPGVGMAYEVYPGRTQFTRGSELQNAETSAWGRAIVAALAADAKKGIATDEEVRNRRAEQEQPEPEPVDTQAWEAQIAAATTTSQLSKVGAGFSRLPMPTATRAELQRQYAQRLAELAQPRVVDAQLPEPGAA